MKDSELSQFANEFDRCWLCGTRDIHTWPPRLEIHHIVRGASREKAKTERCALVRTCPRCHSERLDFMPIVIQLALKRMYDQTGYDRQKVNALRCRADESITEVEVIDAVTVLEKSMLSSGYPFPRWRF